MKTPMVPEKGDKRWKFVRNVLLIFERRKVRKIVSKLGLTPLSRTIAILNVVILAMCFEEEITFVVSELRAKAPLREFTGVYEIQDAEDVYRFLSRFSADQFVNMVLSIINATCGRRKRGKAVIIVDTTNLTVNINWFRKKYKKEDLKDKDYKWAYSKSKGYYIGMKLVLALDYPLLKPLAFLVFPGGPSDSKIFDKIVVGLMRRRILKKADFFVLDKGFYAYRHYTDSLLKYSIVPVIFPKKNFKLGKVLNSIQLTLDFFCDKPDRIKKKIQLLKAILHDFKRNILNWEQFKPKRSLIEDVIKVMKKTFSLDKIHRYTLSSLTKQASIAVLLVGVSISMGFSDKKQLQRLAEW